MASETVNSLVLTFATPINLKFTRLSNVPDLNVVRTEDVQLSSLHYHLQESLNISYQESLSLLPIAICYSTNSQGYIKLPLVTAHIWKNLIDQYPYNTVRIVLETRPSLNLSPPTCSSLLRKELKMLDASYYLPHILERRNLVCLGEDILHKDFYIKPKLRRGFWMHLLGVFHPALKTKEQREIYMNKLRRIYDALKRYDISPRWGGRPPQARVSEEAAWSQQIRHLRESVQRDAVRTDPNERFLALPENMQKLVDIITIYTLEHSEIKYTQGMTDLLSPILYVMGREDDAYICFAAMFDRIKVNFTEWCEGTLNKLERLKHLCEVLDPELYSHLSGQQLEDPFVLFFGMVLIECRREFNFQEGLHLFEVLWASALRRDAPTLEEVSQANWASFMTSVSTHVTYQTFGDEGVPYSTQPLEEDSVDMIISPEIRSPGSASSAAQFIPIVSNANGGDDEGLLYETPTTPILEPDNFLSCSPDTPLKRSVSLPDSEFVLIDANSFLTQSSETKSEGDLDIAGTVDASGGTNQVSSVNTEMADLSSVSSSNGHRNSSGDECATNSDTKLNMKTQSRDEIPTHDGGDHHDEPGTLFQCSSEHEDDVFPSIVRSKPFKKQSQTLPRNQRKSTDAKPEQESVLKSSTLPRTGSTLPPAPFLHHLSRPSLSSPYVSSIRALDPRISYPNTNLDPFQDEFDSPSPHSSPMRLSPVYTASPHSQTNDYNFSPAPSPLVHAIQSSDVSPQQINRPQSIEGSLEVSHVLSGLMSGEHTHPNVNRETSLRIKMADAFSLFVCLAILVNNRKEILNNQMDFVSLSIMLNDQAENQSLPTILKIARQLHGIYFKYQTFCLDESCKRDFRMFETWLDDPSVLSRAAQTTHS